MENRKQRIAAFIETLDSKKLSGSIVLGGKKKDKQTSAPTNSKCRNVSEDRCYEAKNETECYNTGEMCDASTNEGYCTNGYIPETQAP